MHIPRVIGFHEPEQANLAPASCYGQFVPVESHEADHAASPPLLRAPGLRAVSHRPQNSEPP